MEDYHKLSEKTRTLEQQYTQQFALKCKTRISELMQKIENLQQQTTQAADVDQVKEKYEELVVRCADLEKQVLTLTKEKEKLEKRLLNQEASTRGSKAQENDSIIEEIREKHQESIKLINQIVKKLNEKQVASTGIGVQTDQQGRIKRLEDEIENLRSENSQLAKREKEQKDRIILLKDTVESKEKTIQTQKAQIEKLKKEANSLENERGKDIIMPEIPSAMISVQADPWALPKETPAPKKQKNVKKEVKKINVGSLIREDNKSFFNDLSFSNSSPVVDKNLKRSFK